MIFVLGRTFVSIWVLSWSLFFYSFNSIQAQFSGYTTAESSAYNSALFSNGAGLKDSMSNLGGNQSFLISHNKNIVDAGAGVIQAQTKTAPVLINGGGFYVLTENLGIGIRLRPVLNRSFPTDSRLINYTGQAVISYKINEILFLGFGLGPSVSNRPGGFSTYSWNATGSIGFLFQKLSMGLVAESPGANRFETYLGTEKLKERYPERLSFGIQWNFNPELFFYGEVNRTFWERAMFSQNGLEEKPSFPIKTTITGSLGLGYRFYQSLELLSGLTQFANANANGSLDPVYGASFGLKGEILPSVFGAGFFGSFYVQRTGIRKPLEEYQNETRIGFQFHSIFFSETETNKPPNP